MDIRIEVESEMAEVFFTVLCSLHQLEETLVHHPSNRPGQLGCLCLGMFKSIKDGLASFRVEHTRKIGRNLLCWVRFIREPGKIDSSASPCPKEVA